MSDDNKTAPELEPAAPIDLRNQLRDPTNNPGGEGLVTFLGVPLEELQKLVNAQLNSEGAIPFLNAVRERGSYDNLLYFAVESTMAAEYQRVANFLTKKADSENGLEDFSPLLMSKGENPKPILGPSAVSPSANRSANREPAASGSEAILRMIAARAGNIRRIPLFNSGFAIDIRVPTVNEVNELLRQCRIDKGLYESQLGAPFYMFYDRLVKVRFIEFVLKLVVASTLKNWSLEGVLLSSIKLADYNPLLAHVAAMMYPKGYPNFRRVCTRPRDQEHPKGCNHVESITADVGKMVHTRFGLMTPDAVTYMCKARLPSTVITPDDISQYQNFLGFDGKTVDFGGYRWVFKTPTLADHLDAAAVFNTELLNEVKADNQLGISAAMRPRELRQYGQYIATVSVLDQDGEPIETTGDQEAIAFFLDQVYEIDGVMDQLKEPLVDFVNESQLSYVCYPVYACPSCGHVPDVKSGFFVVDAENTFFTMALLKSITGL